MQSTNKAEAQTVQPRSEPSIFESHDQGADHAKKPKSGELSNEQHHQDQQHAGPGVDGIADPSNSRSDPLRGIPRARRPLDRIQSTR